MTRKRFVRLLMACYYRRDEALATADTYNKMGFSYAEAWEHEKVFAMSRRTKHMVKIGIRNTGRALHSIVEAVRLMACSVQEASRAIPGIRSPSADHMHIYRDQ